MGLPVLGELQAVFQIAQKTIRGDQAAELGGRKQILLAEARKRQHRSAMAQPGNAAAMQALQALHQKLDVADAARSQLDVERRFAQPPLAQLFADALARGGHFFHRRKIERSGVNQRLHGSAAARGRRSGSPAATRALISICNSQSRARV